jgi:CheY-like chemotaxis protein
LSHAVTTRPHGLLYTRAATVTKQLAVVLLVDDTPDDLEVFSLALNQEGIATLTASDGEEGLRLAVDAQPSVIVLDVALPRVDGLEIAHRLKANPLTRAILIVILTASPTTDVRAAAEKLGVECVLEKPCHPDRLAAEIRRCLRELGIEPPKP